MHRPSVYKSVQVQLAMALNFASTVQGTDKSKQCNNTNMLLIEEETPTQPTTDREPFHFDGTISLSVINLAEQAFSILLSFYWV